MDERRRFERVNLPDDCGVYVLENGKRLGMLRVLGRGGLEVESERRFTTGDSHELTIVDESEYIRRTVSATVRNAERSRTGFQFDELDVDAAVEVGVIIGKYYAAAQP